MKLKCEICDYEFKKDDIVFEEVRNIYRGKDETFPEEVLHRWCEDCEYETQRRLEQEWNQIEAKEKKVKRILNKIQVQK